MAVKQKTLNKESTPLEQLLQLIDKPSKNSLGVYTEIIKRWLLRKPLNINMNAYEILANVVGIEPDRVRGKVETLDRSGYINVDYWTLIPCFKPKENVTEQQLAAALKAYHESIIVSNGANGVIKDPKTLLAKMHDMCPKTNEAHDHDLCKMHRWIECDMCVHKVREK